MLVDSLVVASAPHMFVWSCPLHVVNQCLESISQCESYIRLVKKPTMFPQTSGSSTAAAGFSKIAVGSVRDGMYVVILLVFGDGGHKPNDAQFRFRMTKR